VQAAGEADQLDQLGVRVHPLGDASRQLTDAL
jgi:hypothetical protein